MEWTTAASQDIAVFSTADYTKYELLAPLVYNR